MKSVQIYIIRDKEKQKALINIDRISKKMTFLMKGSPAISYTAKDFYTSFGQLRADFPKISFLCKGSKLNVHPSSMSLQMSGGLVAYEITLNEPTNEEDVVRIFDYEENNLTNSIESQREFYKSWLRSLGFDLPQTKTPK